MNLASPNPEFLARSRDAFVDRDGALPRARHPATSCFHPGRAHGRGRGRGPGRGRAQPGRTCSRAREGRDVMPLLEVTAGQGSCLGHRFEHLAAIFDRVREPERVGVCLDTCHLYAAGYDIATAARATSGRCATSDRIVGLRKLKAIHLNDSKRERGQPRRSPRAAPARACWAWTTFRADRQRPALPRPAHGAWRRRDRSRNGRRRSRCCARWCVRGRRTEHAGRRAPEAMTPAARAARAQGAGPRGGLRPRGRRLRGRPARAGLLRRTGSPAATRARWRYLTSQAGSPRDLRAAFPWARSVVCVGLQYDTPGPYSDRRPRRTAAGSRATPGATTTTTS